MQHAALADCSAATKLTVHFNLFGSVSHTCVYLQGLL